MPAADEGRRSSNEQRLMASGSAAEAYCEMMKYGLGLLKSNHFNPLFLLIIDRQIENIYAFSDAQVRRGIVFFAEYHS